MKNTLTKKYFLGLGGGGGEGTIAQLSPHPSLVVELIKLNEHVPTN